MPTPERSQRPDAAAALQPARWETCIHAKTGNLWGSAHEPHHDKKSTPRFRDAYLLKSPKYASGGVSCACDMRMCASVTRRQYTQLAAETQKTTMRLSSKLLNSHIGVC